MSKKSHRGRLTYSLFNYLDFFKSIRNMGTHLRFGTVSFNRERTQLHQEIIDTIMPKAEVAQKKRPKAYVVIGGLGSGKGQVLTKLKQQQEDLVCIDSELLQGKLVEHEHSKQSETAKSKWFGWLQKESIFLRQKLLHQAITARRDVLFKSVGTDKQQVQDTIDVLRAAGYDVALHLVDTSEAVATVRVSEKNKVSDYRVSQSSVKKSNRAAKHTFHELARANHGTIDSHRWSNDGSEPQLDDHQEVNQYFEWFLNTLDEPRTNLLKELGAKDRGRGYITDHLNNIEQLKKTSPHDRNAHTMLITLISDMALFPELYFGYKEQLKTLYRLVNKNDFHVYYTSIKMLGPLKSHGGVMIGTPKLQKGVSLSTAGDFTRSQITLPDEFKQKLINAIIQHEHIPDAIVSRFGVQEHLLNVLGSERFFDSYALKMLITHCAPELLDEYSNEILRCAKYKVSSGLWDKPRTNMQNKDGDSFNQQFPTYLKEQRGDYGFQRVLGHLYHGMTRAVAIREQRHVAVSTVLTRWLELAEYKEKQDSQRGLKFNKENEFWNFVMNADSERGGNCNTGAAYLLGADPETASLFNVGTTKARQMVIPRAAAIQLGLTYDFEKEKNNLLGLLDKKMKQLYRELRAEKYFFLLDVKTQLEHIELNDVNGINRLLIHIDKADSYHINKFHRFGLFSRFKSSSGQRITESQKIVSQVRQFLEQTQKELTAKKSVPEENDGLSDESFDSKLPF